MICERANPLDEIGDASRHVIPYLPPGRLQCPASAPRAERHLCSHEGFFHTCPDCSAFAPRTMQHCLHMAFHVLVDSSIPHRTFTTMQHCLHMAFHGNSSYHSPCATPAHANAYAVPYTVVLLPHYCRTTAVQLPYNCRTTATGFYCILLKSVRGRGTIHLRDEKLFPQVQTSP